MKKLFLLLALCFSIFASAQCPVVNLTQNAKWKFMFSQCFEDTTNHSYVLANNIAYFDANKNLTYISYAALLDSLNVPSATPAGNNHNIQFNSSGAFGASTDFNYNGTTGVFYVYDLNGDTLFSVNTQTRETKVFSHFVLPELADSALTFLDANKHLVNDSNNLAWDGNTLYLLNKNNASTSTGALVITSNTQSLGRVVQSISSNTATAGPQYQYFRSRGTLAAPTVPIAGSVLGEINFGGYNGTSFTGTGNRIRATAGGTWTSTAQPAYYTFITSDDNAGSFSSFVTKKGSWSIKGSENDTNLTLYVHGTAMIEVTPRNYDLTDSILVKDDTTHQLKAWMPVRLFGLKGDTNTFGNLITGTINSGAVTSTSVVQGTAFVATAVNNGFIFNASTRIKSPTNGNLILTNANENGFTSLGFGVASNAFFQIRINGTIAQFRLGDNSDYSPVETGSLSVNGTANASAAVTINSTTQGFLPPVMTAAQGSAIGTPAQGLMIFVTTTNGTFTAIGWWGFDGTNWVQIG